MIDDADTPLADGADAAGDGASDAAGDGDDATIDDEDTPLDAGAGLTQGIQTEGELHCSLIPLILSLIFFCCTVAYIWLSKKKEEDAN